MGIKDNFQQALRELTGTEKETDEQKHERSVDAMKNAVSTDTSEFDAIDDSVQYAEIQRRAAAAADEYERQQDAFNSGSYDDPNVAPPPQSMTLGSTNFDPDDDDILEMNRNSDDIPFVQPLQPGVTAVPPPPQPQQNTPPLYEHQPQQDTYQQQNAYQQPQQNPYQQQNTYQHPRQNQYQQQDNYRRQNQGYQQQGLNMGAPQQNGYQQQTRRQAPQQPFADPAAEQAAIFSTQRYARPMNDDDEVTMISRNTVVDGNIRSFANMSVDGNVKGNIETTKDIDLNGKVVGNISCNNAQMRTSQIQGNIRMKGNAYMERDTLLIGDLTATYANVNGKIKGNLSTTGKSELKSDAVVFGDISASTITVNDGAIIQGYVSTTFLNKEESSNIFPDTITIGE